MNRRSFFSTLGLASASFAILPSATMYERRWVSQGTLLVPGEWYVTPIPQEHVFQYVGYKTFRLSDGYNVQRIPKPARFSEVPVFHRILSIS